MENATLSDTASSSTPSQVEVARVKALRDARVRALLAERVAAQRLSRAFANVVQGTPER
jgi:hypothetical protein